MIDDNFIDLKRQPTEMLEIVARTPASALGSTRDKPNEEYCLKIFEAFRKHNVRYFFYIGGNDSAETANIVNKIAQREKYDLQVVHVPKTIDNDLLVTDHCPGFGCAAKFVASAFIGDNMDNRALPGVKINVLMGREAGFITAASILARRREDDGPHLIYMPERPFLLERFYEDVAAVVSKYGRCLVAISEGIRDAEGTHWATKLAKQVEKDSFGNVQLSAGAGALGEFLAGMLKQKLPQIKRVRADTYGYLQRSFPGCTSEVDAWEARLVGQMAVSYAVGAGGKDGSVALVRLPGTELRGRHRVRRPGSGRPGQAADHQERALRVHQPGWQLRHRQVPHLRAAAGRRTAEGRLVRAGAHGRDLGVTAAVSYQ